MTLMRVVHAQVLRLDAFSFTLDLATVAQRKDLINLEAWLQESLKADSADRPFVTACIEYLREKLLGGGVTRGAGSASVSVLSVDAAASFFRSLRQADLPELLARQVASLYTECVQAKPKLQALFSEPDGMAASPIDPSSEPEAIPVESAVSTPETVIPAPAVAPPTSIPVPEPTPNAARMSSSEPIASTTGASEMQFSAEVEEEANSYFQKIYNDAISIEESECLDFRSFTAPWRRRQIAEPLS